MPKAGKGAPRRLFPQVSYVPDPARVWSYFPRPGCDLSHTDSAGTLERVVAGATVLVANETCLFRPRPVTTPYFPISVEDKFAGWLLVEDAVLAALCFRVSKVRHVHNGAGLIRATPISRTRAEVRVLLAATCLGRRGIQVGVCAQLAGDNLEIRFYSPDP